ncbi:hypothetical protein [Nafulsella turpanensis]|uniref:hypothetical protein n=1 Tax=Nafulsella turpanensis TaxID=1265690 RepID=UPI000348F941|nr:hypothetical protein [Nafulsella turpanensis]
MKKRLIVCICFLLLIQAGAVLSQTEGELNLNMVPIPKSPEVAALGKYGEIPVSTYTGIPSISIPIFALKGRQLEAPISLSYHAGGIKVEEIATSVGLGWNLNYGGMVTRITRGIADDEPTIGFLNSDFKPSDFLEISNPPTTEMTVKMQQALNQSIDLEPDLFYFNFNGFSGEFFFDEKGDYHFKSHQNMRIEKVVESEIITGWIFTTPDGTKYYFGKSKNAERLAVEKSSVTIKGAARDSRLDPHITSWFLLDITNVNGTDKIEYFYNKQLRTVCSRGEEKKIWIMQSLDCEDYKRYTPVTYITSLNEGVRIKEIKSAFNTVRFHFDTDRQDLKGDKELDKIEILNNDGSFLKKYELKQDYFESSSNSLPYVPYVTTEERTKRLKLISVQEVGQNDSKKPPYLFTYNSKVLPERFSRAIDFWGYYNGEPNSTLIPSFNYFLDEERFVDFEGADRSAKDNFAQACVLEKIQYPTGGHTIFKFEGNKVLKGSWNQLPPEAVQKYSTIVDDDPEAEYYSAEIFIKNTEEFGTIVDYEFTNVPCDSEIATRDCMLWFTIVGVTDPSFYFKADYFSGSFKLKEGIYKVSVIKRNVDFDFDRLKFSWKENPEEEATGTGSEVMVGGLRVKEVRSFDPITNNQNAIFYSYNNFGKPQETSGYLSAGPKFFWKQDPSGCTEDCELLIMTSSSQYPLATSKGGYAGYTNVEEKRHENGENGYTRYYYSFDYDDERASTSYPFAPPNTMEHRRGNLQLKEVYDINGKKIRSEKNNYIYLPIHSDFHNYSVTGIKVSGIPDKAACFKEYQTSGEWYYLESQEVVSYENEEFVFKTEYKYDHPEKHVFPTRIIHNDSKGIPLTREKIYPTNSPEDFSISLSKEELAAKEEMLESYFIGEPIEEVVYWNSYKATSKTFKSYFVENGSLFLRHIKQAAEGESYIEKVSVVSYDDFGNPTEVVKADDVPQSFIYSEGGKYLIGVASNAKFNQIFYTSFEEDGELDTEAKSGARVKELNSEFNFSNKEFPAGSYFLSYFKKVNGKWEAVNEKIKHAGGTLGRMLVGRIDELRLFPEGAHFVTYTYEEGKGVSSRTDENGMTTYYRYDNLGRLELILDNSRNHLQSHKYQYSSSK